MPQVQMRRYLLQHHTHPVPPRNLCMGWEMIRAGVQPSGFRTHVSRPVDGWQSLSEANDLGGKRREPENTYS